MRLNFLILCLVFSLIFAGSVLGATTKDFIPISEQGQSFFTHKDIKNADYFLGTDKIFYGSKEGQVIMKVYFSEKNSLTAKDFKLGLETKNGKKITITKVKIGETEIEIYNPLPSNTFIFNQAIRTESGILKSAEIYISFDPAEIGILEEIDVILYSKSVIELLRFDPFLSGYGYRQKMILDTDGIGLGSDVTIDYTFPVYLAPDNNYWVTDTCGDGTGITFTQTDELTELDFDVEEFNSGDQNYWLWVEGVETFPSASNLELWHYWGGACVDNSDGANAYPANVVSVYHLNEASGNIDNAEGTAAFDGTAVGTATYEQTGKIGSAIDLNPSDPDYFNIRQPTNGSAAGTILIWVNKDVDAEYKLIGGYEAGAANGFQIFLRASGESSYASFASASASGDNWSISTTAGVSLDTWYLISASWGAAGVKIGVNAGSYGTTATTDPIGDSGLDEFLGARNFTTPASLDGLLDETKIFNTQLSDDEVLLIYNAESFNLITFGEQELSSISPDVNVSYPQSNEQFEQGAVSTIDITFNVQDGDSNSLIVDLNYSPTNTQASGTSIINDTNTTGASITCDDSDFSNVTNCAYSWDIDAIPDGNYYILVTVSDGTNETFDAGDLNFSIYTIPPVQDYNITFNVFQNTGTDFNLSGLTMDFNVDYYDQSGLTSPFTISDINAGHYLVELSKAGWDSNTFVLVVDANETTTKYLDKWVYPAIAQFTKSGDNNTSQTSFQSIQTWSFESSYGATSKTDVGCSFWVTSDNIVISSATWRIQTSENGTVWTTRKVTTRTINPNTAGGSIFIQTPDFNILDGTHYFKLQHKIAPGGNYNLDTHDVVCNKFIARDQNNFIIQDFSNTQTNLSTSNINYSVASTLPITTEPFNGFYYYYGDMVYSQTVAKGIGYIRMDLKNIADSNSAEYPRTTNSGSIGIGGFSGIFKDLNASNLYNAQTYTKTSAGTTAFSYDLHLHYFNQKIKQYDQNKNLNGTTLTTSTPSKIATLTLNPITRGDFLVYTVLPFSCSEANCDLNIFIGASGNGYDLNSLSHKRTSDTTPNDVGVLVTQFLFPDVNIGTINFDLWGSTSAGTITFEGGSFSVIKANETNVLIASSPQNPLIYAPINGSDVNGALVDYNCWTTDPDNDFLTYDVNIIVRDTNALAINLESAGNGYGTFDSTTIDNNTYYISCSATDGTFLVKFDNSNYNFTITNPIIPVITPPAEIPFERYFAPDDPRELIEDTNRFLNEEKAIELDPFKRLEDYSLLILTVIIILFLVYVLFMRRS